VVLCARQRAAQQGIDAIPHLTGGLIGKRDRQDCPARHPAGGDQMGDAVRDDPGFAAACASQDQQRPFGVLDGFSLAGVQTVTEIHENTILARVKNTSI
jgi:hypothetical protein